MPELTPLVDLNEYIFSGREHAGLPNGADLKNDSKQELRMVGVDMDGENQHAGTLLQIDHSSVHCASRQKGLEMMPMNEALRAYDGLPEYFWKAINPDQDEYTRIAAREPLHGGYFIHTTKGAKIAEPVQSCLYIQGEKVGQNVHNVVIVEEDSELHLITGCTTAHNVVSALHLGVSEFYIKKGGKLTFSMIHHWGDGVAVRPRTAGIVEENGVFQNNYVLLQKVRTLQSYPTIYLNGEGAVARFTTVVVAPEGSHVDSGSRIVLNAPNTRGEILSRAITTGGTMIARGEIIGAAAPARGHLECKGLILGGGGVIRAVPELQGRCEGVELSHEAAVGKIAQEEIEYLMARGLDEDQATSTIVRGFLNVEIMGLPPELRAEIDKTISEINTSGM